jgi:putative N-acetyltransferase (TIGR04045 family)
MRARPTVRCREVQTREELAEHYRIRREVFVLEQQVFTGTDLDEHDAGGATHLIGYCDGVAAGSVRLFALDPEVGCWQGDRLAVLPAFRASGIGAPLVRCAVAVAGASGGSHMLAHVQLANVAFFTRLGWSSVGQPETYVGLPHQLMRISLPPAALGASIVEALAGGAQG